MKLPGIIGRKIKQLKYYMPVFIITLVTIIFFIAMVSMIIKVIIIAGLILLLYNRFTSYKNRTRDNFWGRK